MKITHCENCNGKGYVPYFAEVGTIKMPCEDCQGTGHIVYNDND